MLQSVGWQCPNCGKAHAPHVVTCPESAKDALPTVVPICWPANWAYRTSITPLYSTSVVVTKQNPHAQITQGMPWDVIG